MLYSSRIFHKNAVVEAMFFLKSAVSQFARFADKIVGTILSANRDRRMTNFVENKIEWQ